MLLLYYINVLKKKNVTAYSVYFDNDTVNYLDQIKFAYKISSITATNPKSFNVIINKNIFYFSTNFIIRSPIKHSFVSK